MPDNPSRSSNRRNKSVDQKAVQKDTKSSDDIKKLNTDSKDHPVDTQNSKQERPARKVEPEETALKDEIVKEVKPKETTVKKESAKKAKDWGRASNDPRNK